ncbi:MAG: hypothetical protein AAF518_10155 [Spirochaetota bacterium]
MSYLTPDPDLLWQEKLDCHKQIYQNLRQIAQILSHGDGLSVLPLLTENDTIVTQLESLDLHLSSLAQNLQQADPELSSSLQKVMEDSIRLHREISPLLQEQLQLNQKELNLFQVDRQLLEHFRKG